MPTMKIHRAAGSGGVAAESSPEPDIATRCATPAAFGQFCEPSKLLKRLVPAVWIEQTTYRLQGGCSTAELSRHIYRDSRAAPSLQRPVLLPLPRH